MNDIEFEEPCIIHVLRMSGVDETVLSVVKERIPGYCLAKKNLHDVARVVGKRIRVTQTGGAELERRGRHTSRKVMFGREGDVIDIGLFMDHCFILEQTRCTHYAIANYNMVKNEREWWRIDGRDRGGRFHQC